jgi:hypothetical protein
MHYEFDSDLLDARRVEKEFADYVEEKYGTKALEFNNDKRYDIKFQRPTGKIFTVEVKSDYRASETGNSAVEYECRGKPSGINTTQADYWVYKFDNNFYIITVTKLKSLITEKRYHRTVIGGDSGSNTKMYLFHLRDFQRHMKKI